MRGVAIAAEGAPDSANFVVLLGSAGEQVGYLEPDTPPGDIQPALYRGIDFRHLLVTNNVAQNEDQIILGLENGTLPVNYFSKLIMRGATQNLIILQTNAVFQFDNFPGASPPFSTWLWKRAYRTTWPESIRGQKRLVKII